MAWMLYSARPSAAPASVIQMEKKIPVRLPIVFRSSFVQASFWSFNTAQSRCGPALQIIRRSRAACRSYRDLASAKDLKRCSSIDFSQRNGGKEIQNGPGLFDPNPD